jgi:NADH:ubiquinone oxidoreductase subunit K
MSLSTGLAALFIGVFLIFVGMYGYAWRTGQIALFAGLGLVVAGVSISFLSAGRRRR